MSVILFLNFQPLDIDTADLSRRLAEHANNSSGEVDDEVEDQHGILHESIQARTATNPGNKEHGWQSTAGQMISHSPLQHQPVPLGSLGDNSELAQVTK